MARKERKDKGISKPRKGKDAVLTLKEFKKLPRKEQERRLTNLANTLNRRLDRLEKYGLGETEGAREIKERAREVGATKSGRISKSWGNRTEKEILKAYRVLAPVKKQLSTLVKNVLKILRDILPKKGEETEQETFKRWNDLTKQEQTEFWRAFYRLRDILEPLVRAGLVDSDRIHPDSFREFVESVQGWENPADYIERYIKERVPQFERARKKMEEEFERMRTMPGFDFDPNDL